MPETKKQILVIGGGISGITTAIEAAETGFQVILVEKNPYLGGKVAQISKYFPKLCPPTCGLEINFQRISRNSNIQIFTSTKLKNISGSRGDFSVTLIKKPEMVTTDCTSCGACVEVCPETRPNAFNQNLSETKAIYLPHEMSYPWRYTIDEAFCNKESCGKCVEVCKYSAINLAAQSEEIYIQVASIVVATGWESYPAGQIENLQYSQYQDIISNLEMERLISPNGPTQGKFIRLSDGEPVKNIAFVQCAGSRDENYQEWCSGVCCSASLKQSLLFMESNPDGKATIFYIDLRVTGRNEDFLNRVNENNNIDLVKGKVAAIEFNKSAKKYIVEAEDIEAGKKIANEFDLVVLATGITPNAITIFENSSDEYGFIDPGKLPDGVYGTGCCVSPMDVSASLKSATGRALKALQIVKSTSID